MRWSLSHSIQTQLITVRQQTCIVLYKLKIENLIYSIMILI